MQGEQALVKAATCLLPMFVSNVLVKVSLSFMYVFVYGRFCTAAAELSSCVGGGECLRRLKYACTIGHFLKRFAMVNYINWGTTCLDYLCGQQ